MSELRQLLAALEASYKNGVEDGKEMQRARDSRFPTTSLGYRYTTMGRFADDPRPDPEEDSHLYDTPRQVWTQEWLNHSLESGEDVGNWITQEEYFRIGAEIVKMADADTVGSIRFNTRQGDYCYEVVEVELLMRPTGLPRV